MTNSKDLTVLVQACIKYDDVLQAFEKLFLKFWSDCPYDVVLSTDSTSEYSYPYSKVVETKHPGNTIRVREAIESITTPYVLLLTDDSLLIDHVDNERFGNLIEYAKKYQAGNIRFGKGVCPYEIFNEQEELYIFKPGPYRIAMAGGGIWDTEFLRTLLNKYSDSWNFERKGSYDEYALTRKVFFTKYKDFPCIDAVGRGKWFEFAATILSINHIDIDESVRKIETSKDICKSGLKRMVFETNPNLITKIQNRLYK